MFLAGIDEAGYGPLLGPFTAGWSLFRVPDAQLNLWEVTAKSCHPKPPRKDRRLMINDSKKVNAGPRGRDKLERAVAAFRELAAGGEHGLDNWLSSPPATSRKWLQAAPWFKKLDGTLCSLADRSRAKLDANLILRDLENSGCTFAGFGSRAVPAGEWNSLIDHFQSKGLVLFEVTMNLVEHVLKLSDGSPIRIECDRHGARRRYGQALMERFNTDSIEVHAETASGSLYTLMMGGRKVEIRFSQGADLNFFPVALASLAAKQTRERLMDQWNTWFNQRLPDIRPTKGYTQDGRRWLHDVGDALDAFNIDQRLLKRIR